MYIYLFPEIRRQQINEKEHNACTDTMRIQTNKVDLLKPINALPLLLRSLALVVCFVCAVCGKAGPEAMRRPGRQKCVRQRG